jgi:dipeptidyl aminopeptidase/acylaminoacyl peptidase
MPWEGTELYYSEFPLPVKDQPLAPLKPVKIAGQHLNISINDLKWDTTDNGNPNKLYYLSDQTGFVNLWSVDLGGEPGAALKPDIAMYPLAHDLSEPLWTLNPSWYAIMSSKEAIIAPNLYGERSLAHVDLQRKRVSPITSEYRDITQLQRVNDRQAVFLAGKYDEPRKIVVVTLGSRAGDATFQEVEVSTTTKGGPKLDQAYISKGELITLTVQFPPPPPSFSSSLDENIRSKNVDLHVTLYPPTNPEYQAPKDELPPVICQVHGGPTARSSPVFNILYQYFTTRGFAVLDVDYGGSSGYGREYQDRLKGRWGEVDVHDTIQAVVELGKMGKIDAKRVAIMGGSAGKLVAGLPHV